MSIEELEERIKLLENRVSNLEIENFNIKQATGMAIYTPNGRITKAR